MELIRNLDDANMGEVYWRLYRRYISLFIENEADDAYAWRCARALDELDDAVIERLCAASLRYRAARLERLGESAEEVAPARGVLERIEPGELIVPDPEQGDEAVIHLSLNCEWDREHGMEWIVRGGEVLYVDPFHGEDPWRDFTVKEPWNYA
ncbi:hypothetical protein I5E21_17675 [Pseudomonas aeruginosa]|nr:hypothetical protein [Pseudomonas aeruginosa]MBG5273262.1 hypothetical protein [Pseudomonas aeruginosa]MBG5291009.1 hypothetical protein [Pseudomonas aeruginosa]MBG5297168.1 hypothetical protein [Pseudomonas aeruginosa]